MGIGGRIPPLLAVNDACQAWYASAIRVFPAGTAQGDMIRGTIPTTYSPPSAPAPVPAPTPAPTPPQ